MWTQYVQRNPTTKVPIMPNTRPALRKAIGMAKIPVPKELFNKCAKAPLVDVPDS